MKITNSILVKVKETQSLRMYYDTARDHLVIKVKDDFGDQTISLPTSKVFQLIRGLTAYTQRFYRRKK